MHSAAGVSMAQQRRRTMAPSTPQVLFKKLEAKEIFAENSQS